MTLRTLLAVVALALAAGCTSISKIGPGQVTIKDMTLTLEGPWNKFESSALVLYQAPGATEIWTREGFTLDVLAFCTSASAFLWLGTIVVGWRAIGIVQHAMDTLISPHANRNEFGMDVGVLLALGAGGCVVAGCVIGLVIALTEEHQR